ncbi:MAG: hypothetical protein E7044_15010, partial [Lentisphaerae bacterium]|nr:hypothetical protein [Lentisphaerota bacterium]
MKQKSFALLELPVITSLPQLDTKRTEKNQSGESFFFTCLQAGEAGSFTLIELLVNAACKTGVLYNRCGMLLSKGGALVRKSTEEYGRVRS